MTRRTATGRTPKQDRSRVTEKLILSATIKVLEKRGYQDFTLQEVCNSCGLSIGAIYSRFSGKEDLLHAAQAQLIETLDTEVDRFFIGLTAQQLSFDQIVPAIVKDLAGLFRKHHSVMRPMMALAANDPIMRQEGFKWDARTATRFRNLLLQYRDSFRHPNPERAVNTCFDVLFSAVTRFLGLGTAPDVRGQGSWQDFVDDLARMAVAFMLYSPGEASKNPQS